MMGNSEASAGEQIKPKSQKMRIQGFWPFTLNGRTINFPRTCQQRGKLSACSCEHNNHENTGNLRNKINVLRGIWYEVPAPIRKVCLFLNFFFNA